MIVESGEADPWRNPNTKFSAHLHRKSDNNFIKNSTKRPCLIFAVDESSYNTLLISMPGADHAQEATGTPDPVERGFATLNTLK